MTAPPLAAPPTLAEIFRTFFRVAMLSFGAAAAFMQQVLVIEKGWLTAKEFAEEFALAQVLPGPNMVNIAVTIGARFRGAAGALTAVVGLIGPPAVLVTLLGVVYGAIGTNSYVRGALTGLSAAAAGFLVVLFLRMVTVLAKSYPREVFVFMAAALGSVAFLKVPLVWAMLVIGSLSIWRAWHRLR